MRMGKQVWYLVKTDRLIRFLVFLVFAIWLGFGLLFGFMFDWLLSITWWVCSPILVGTLLVVKELVCRIREVV